MGWSCFDADTDSNLTPFHALLLIQPASHEVFAAVIAELRLLLTADVHHLGAARAEMAALRWIDRGRHVPFQDDALALFFDHRVGDRHGRQKRLAVRMQGILVQLIRSAISMILPRYMTAMRSEMWRTTDRSWAMNR